MTQKIRVGTRASKMAQFQADNVIRKFELIFPCFSFQKIVVSADADRHEGSLRDEGGKGAFVSRLDNALVKNEIDISVNCLKDIPNSRERTANIIIAGVLPRDEFIDVVISRTGRALKSLSAGSTVGTVAPRRIAQIARNFPHLKCVHFRGSADTRLSKLDAGVVDAVILAAAGLVRIGMRHRVTEELPELDFPPAFGAGVVTMDCLDSRDDIKAMIQHLNDEKSFRCMAAERAFIDNIGGNCTTAMAGIAKCLDDNSIHLRVVVYSPDGTRIIEDQGSCLVGEEVYLGTHLALSIKSRGASRIMAAKDS